MSEEKKQLIATINEMPEEWTIKILAYIKKLKDEDYKDMPERLIAKDEDDLAKKLEEAIEDKESIPLSEVVDRMNKIIAE